MRLRARAPRLAWVVLAPAILGAAMRATADESPRLQGGAVEIGLAGALAANGSTTVTVSLRGGRFFALGDGLVALEAETGWTHVRELDGLDLLASAEWLPWSKAAVLPFVGAIGGVRQEWLGSFREARAPVGALLGVRVLASHGAAIRTEYRLLRVTGDPIRNYTEHRLQVGVSLLLGNGPR